MFGDFPVKNYVYTKCIGICFWPTLDTYLLLLHCYLCPYLGHGHGPLWPGQGHLPPRLRLLLVSSWPKRKQPEQKQGIKRMPKTRVHSTLCKVPARSQPTLTTQELQFYSWSRELMMYMVLADPRYVSTWPWSQPTLCCPISTTDHPQIICTIFTTDHPHMTCTVSTTYHPQQIIHITNLSDS